MEAPSSWGALEHAIADAMKEAEQARVDKIIGLSTVRRIADKLRERGIVGATSHAFRDCEEASEPEQDEPPFDENHHRFHTPRGPNPECANCAYVNFSQPS